METEEKKEIIEVKDKYTVDEIMDVLNFTEKALMKMIEAKSNDGKIDMAEWFGMSASLAPDVIKAVTGADQIPFELGDLKSHEVNVIMGKFMSITKLVLKLAMPSSFWASVE